MTDVKIGEDVDLEQMANAMLAQDAESEGLDFLDYKQRYGLMRRKHRDEMSVDPDVLASLADTGRGTKVP